MRVSKTTHRDDKRDLHEKQYSKFAIIFIRYHIPRSFIKPSENLIVVLEEEKGNPNEMEILLVRRHTICSFITKYHPPHVRSWQRKDSKIRPVFDVVKPAAHQTCVDHGDDQELENKSCRGIGKEECLARRTFVAHLDYIMPPKAQAIPRSPMPSQAPVAFLCPMTVATVKRVAMRDL
jgi:hypothetical protein